MQTMLKRPLRRNLAGVYMLFYRHQLVYVGQSAKLWQRIGAHDLDGSIPFDSWSYLEIKDAVNRRQKEAELIASLAPPYNRVGLPVAATRRYPSPVRRKLRGIPLWNCSDAAWRDMPKFNE